MGSRTCWRINGIAIVAFMAMEFLRHRQHEAAVLPMAIAAGAGAVRFRHGAPGGRTKVRAGVVSIGFILTIWVLCNKTYAA